MSRVVFEYALLRAVPRVERGEAVNVGVVLYCPSADLLVVADHVDEARLRGLDPDVDVDGVREAVRALSRTCAGEGRAADLTRGQRFRWLTAPRSTVVQPGPVHSGLTAAPADEAGRLLDALVRAPGAAPRV